MAGVWALALCQLWQGLLGLPPKDCTEMVGGRVLGGQHENWLLQACHHSRGAWLSAYIDSAWFIWFRIKHCCCDCPLVELQTNSFLMLELTTVNVTYNVVKPQSFPPFVFTLTLLPLYILPTGVGFNLISGPACSLFPVPAVTWASSLFPSAEGDCRCPARDAETCCCAP